MTASHAARSVHLRRFLLPLALSACLLIAHGLFYVHALGGDPVDDAYISFRYAQNAILGHGLVFNPGERVEGFTNFLWTALMIPLEGAGADVGRLSILLGALFALAVLWLVARFGVSQKLRGAGLLAALWLAVDGTFALWAVGGLETALFSFLIFAGAVLYIYEQRSNVWPYSGIFFALAAMTRPEGLMVFAITVAHQLAWRILAERRLAVPRDFGRVFLFGALFVPYWLGRWRYYHSFFPNSFYAKVAPTGPEAQLERGWNHLSQFVRVHMGWLILLPPLAALVNPLRQIRESLVSPSTGGAEGQDASYPLQLRTERPGEASLRGASYAPKQSHSLEMASVMRRVRLRPWDPTGRSARNNSPSVNGYSPEAPSLARLFWSTYFTGIIVVYAAYIVYVGGDWSVGRFFMPLLPFFYLLFSTGLVDMWNGLVDKIRNYEGRWTTRPRPEHEGTQRGRARMHGILPIASGVLTVAIAAFLFVFSSWNGEYGIFIRGFDAATATEARITMGRWLKAHTPPGTLIAVDAAGQVPYFSGLPAIDMFGINDLHIGRLPVSTLGQGTPGHEKFDLGYVVGRAPTYVIIYGTLLDSVKEYERAPVTWTDNPELSKFLTLYVRKP